MTYNDLGLYIRFGDQGNGKSMLGAIDMQGFLKEYIETEKKYPELQKRILFSGEKLNKETERKEIGKHLFYWSSIKQLKYCPRENCWKKEFNPKELGIDYEHQNNPEGKHPIHDCDIYWPEIGGDFGAETSKETPRWMKQLFQRCRKRSNRILFDAQVYEDVSLAIRRQIKHACWVKKLYGSSDIRADKPRPIPFTWWGFVKMWFGGREVLWGRIEEQEFDPKFLEWERDPEKRMEAVERGDLTAGTSEKTWIRNEYVEFYDTQHELPTYRSSELEHVELWCEKENCPLHGINNGKPKIEHYKI